MIFYSFMNRRTTVFLTLTSKKWFCRKIQLYDDFGGCLVMTTKKDSTQPLYRF